MAVTPGLSLGVFAARRSKGAAAAARRGTPPARASAFERLEDRTLLSSPGVLDPSFGTGGKVVTSFAGDAGARSVALQGDGKLVVAGFANGGATADDFALARYNVNGALDATFGTGGRATITFPNGVNASDMAVQADGKIVLVGDTVGGVGGGTAGFENFALARLNANGTLDATFGTGGRVATNVGFSADFATGVAIQPNGKIVVAGYAFFDCCTRGWDFALARYNANGSLDLGFGYNGMATTNIASSPISYDIAFDMLLQPNGRIVVVGSTAPNSGGGPGSFAVVRYRGSQVLQFTGLAVRGAFMPFPGWSPQGLSAGHSGAAAPSPREPAVAPPSHGSLPDTPRRAGDGPRTGTYSRAVPRRVTAAAGSPSGEVAPLDVPSLEVLFARRTRRFSTG